MGVSRQRYWGCPIPIMYDESGKAHPVPKMLVKLPQNINLGVNGNPPTNLMIGKKQL